MRRAKEEAGRWFLEAENDFGFLRRFVEERLGEGGYFNIGCFIAQQAGEKALKACLYATGERHVFTHSLLTMANQLSKNDEAFQGIVPEALRLDRFYIPTRYPNGWPDGAPHHYYTADDVVGAYDDVRRIFFVCRAFMEGQEAV
jgi:HEPN domain-containing protein